MAMFEEDVSLKKIMKNIGDQQRQDIKCYKLLRSLKNKNNGNENLQLFDNVLFIREQKSEIWRIIIPDAIKIELINLTHSKLGHLGVYKTVSYLKRFYYWRTMTKDVKQACT